jgi:hypothetical protein
MKMKSLFLAALLVMTSAVSFAGKDEPRRTGLAVIPVKGSEIFKVIYQGENAGKIKLNIHNASGAIVYSETITGLSGFIFPVNFSGLASGEYTFTVIDGSGKRSETVTYVKTVANTESPKAKINFHVAKLRDGKFLLSVVGAGTTVLTLKIYDQNSNLVHEESNTISGDFAQVYKVINASKRLTFELSETTGTSKRISFL